VFAEQFGNPESFRRYCFLLGALAATASLSRSTDLHFENIVCVAERPVVIDAEFVFGARESVFSRDSVASTGIFGGPLSAFSSATQFAQITSRFVSQRLEMLEPVTSDHHVMIDHATGKVFNFEDEESSFCKGFEAGWKALISRKKEARDVIQDIVTQHTAHYRVLVRNTAYYKLSQLNLWRSLAVSEDGAGEQSARLSSCRRSLLTRVHSSPSLGALVTSEMRDLINGDIPYFWRDNDTCSLYDSRGAAIQGFFRRKLGEDIDHAFKFWSDQYLPVAISRLKHHFLRSAPP
jgi:lantibiotic modifying enzyme